MEISKQAGIAIIAGIVVLVAVIGYLLFGPNRRSMSADQQARYKQYQQQQAGNDPGSVGTLFRGTSAPGGANSPGGANGPGGANTP